MNQATSPDSSVSSVPLDWLVLRPFGTAVEVCVVVRFVEVIFYLTLTLTTKQN